MNDYIKDAQDELKRADHLIYVSLKYTRTVDVLKSVIQRFINCMDAIVTGLVDNLVEKGAVFEMPQAPGLKVSEIKNNYSDPKIEKFVDLYLFFRKLNAAEYSRSNEFRRHVTMTAEVNEEIINIKIETVTDYYQEMKELIPYFAEILKE